MIGLRLVHPVEDIVDDLLLLSFALLLNRSNGDGGYDQRTSSFDLAC